MDDARTDDERLLPGIDVAPSRRAFLHLAGFGIAASALSSCSRRAESLALPWSRAPEDVVAGRAWWIATTCAACPAACGVVARCRDGRPVKLEGNELAASGAGGLCAVGQASLLGLYDSRRPKKPLDGGRETTWAALDGAVTGAIDGLRTRGKLRVLTGTIHSPSTLAWIERLIMSCADARHVAYDALSAAAALDAHARTHGVRALPELDFSAARVIASFDADFLGTWIAPVQFAAQYAARRGTGAARSRHWQFESRLSLTGSRADERVRIAPHEQRAALERLCAALAAKAGETLAAQDALDARVAQAIDRLAGELWSARGESLVVCGVNDVDCQALANEANERLASYGRTLDLGRPSRRRLGDDRALEALAGELERGEIDLLVVAGCNPAYDAPARVAQALARAKTLVACPQELDETAALARWVAPQPHYLEAWDDAEPSRGRFGLTQPAIPALRDTRTLRRTLAAWLGDSRSDRELVAEHWRAAIWPRFGGAEPFDAFFRRALHDGAVELPRERAHLEQPRWRGRGALGDAAAAPRDLALALYPSVALLDGAHAQNPWLQELPDPLTKATWGNVACVAPALAARLGLADGDVVRLECDGCAAIELPAYVQRGQHEGVVAVALGHGRAGTERFANVGPEWLEGRPALAPGERVGVNAAPLLDGGNGYVRTDTRAVRVTKTGARVELPRTQDYDSLELPERLAPHGHEEREHVHAVPAVGAAPEHAAHAAGEGLDLWPDDHAREGPRWGMVIDLARCTGCSACVVGCQAENNVPVVGRDEVRRHREMHWLRIDRYFAGEGDAVRADFQPMLCQHCGHAPCEAVCPVLATVHSSDGLNQQVYNRCVGTRYCANTCPYKVRRFNWFEYAREDALANHALNPDVTVRSRGVMEKCSFCVQRIQDARLEARRERRPLADGAVKTACQQSCPARAIQFGDLADPASAVSKAAADARAYVLLEELNVRPAIRYLARVEGETAAEDRHDG
jgi:molybdopterin-containing oxidoreductase family iron-sulfur binding subunit